MKNQMLERTRKMFLYVGLLTFTASASVMLESKPAYASGDTCTPTECDQECVTLCIEVGSQFGGTLSCNYPASGEVDCLCNNHVLIDGPCS
jgi:hypothetical protein